MKTKNWANLGSSTRRQGYLIALLLAITTASFSGGSTKDGSTPKSTAPGEELLYHPNEVIIKFKPSSQIRLGKSAVGTITTGLQSVDRVLRNVQGEALARVFPGHTRPAVKDAVDLTLFYGLRYRASTDARKVARILESLAEIEYAEPRYLRRRLFTPNDPLYGQQWYLRKIQADKAWDVTRGDSTVIIGIVDTGVEWKHPDLNKNIWRNPNPGQNPNFPADSIGWDFGGRDGTPDNDPDEDRPDHGTAIAGVASAVTNNAIGIAGVGFNCRIMVVKVARDDVRDQTGNALIFYGYEGIVYAADKGASVINTSWGGQGHSRVEQEIIDYANSKGALVVAAAGNAGNNTPIYPAGLNNVLAVGATDSTDRRSVWNFLQSSNYGPHLGVSAPGTNVYSTWKPSTYTPPEIRSGTSFSTPIVCGVAALVKSLHPTWTPEQVAQQIRVTSDPIDHLNNASFAKQLGLGRVNAFRAVNDTSSPGVKMVSYVLSDSIGGNNDGKLDPGETIRLTGQFKNFLRPTLNATAQLTSSDPFIIIVNGSATLGAMGTLQTVANSTSPFAFQIRSNAPTDYQANLYVEFSDAGYRDYTGFTITLNPTFKDHNVNNITMTVTSKGTLGFNDYPQNFQGSGFLFYRSGGENLLFEGAFMAGIAATRVVDAARIDDSFQSSDFSSERNFSLLPRSVVSSQDGLSIFTDGNAGSNKVGIRVTLRTFAFKDAPDDEYIILKYTLVNTGPTLISNLRAGLYLDWDVPESDPSQNLARYDPARRMGYTFDSRVGGYLSHVGTVLLTPMSTQFRAINNAGDDSWGVYGTVGGFTKARKWEALTSGIAHAEAMGDVSMVIGAGPLNIGVGDSTVVAFALVAGLDLAQLQANADAAIIRWGNITTDVQVVSSSIPQEFKLFQNYPNPFNPTTRITFDLPQESRVVLSVYNVLGQEVARLVDSRQPAGRYEVPFSSASFSSGLYFYRIKAGSKTETKKMLLLR